MHTFMRAEQGYLSFYATDGTCIYLSGQELKAIFRWAKYDEKNDLVSDLLAKEILKEADKKRLMPILKRSTQVASPPLSLVYPEQIQVELTTSCPIRCPQCYCDLNGQDLDKEILFNYLRQAAWLDIPYISLSGGEPLVYPDLIETIKYIHTLGLYSAMATSGVGLTTELLGEIKAAGLNEIYVSLNGSTKEIHSKSRAAYEETLSAMKLLKATQTPYSVNWVARDDNVDDLVNMVELCQELACSKIVILALKSDANYEAEFQLKENAFKKLASFLQNHDHTKLPVIPESCFSSMYAYLGKDQLQGIIGCEAGRTVMAINVDGHFAPCRHIPYVEDYKDIKDYWYNSSRLKQLRNTVNNLKSPCSTCQFGSSCYSCRGNALKLYGDIFEGAKGCQAYEAKHIKK